MKIKKMTASFGTLDGARLEPSPGFNLIYAPNEGGKSTWAAFWKIMLYGLDPKDRNKAGHLAEKNRWQPWSGAPMEGELQLEWQGRDITIRRGPRGTAPLGAFSAVYTGTEEPVPGLTAASCGQLLTGVSREVFERSAFIGTGAGLSVSAAPELEKRITSLVSSGQEDVSFSQVQEQLKAWRNRRKVNRSTGLIPRLEGEQAQTMAALDALEEVTADIARLEGERSALARECAGLEAGLTAHRQLARSELNHRCAQAGRELSHAETALRKLKQELSRFGALPPHEELKQAQGELQYIKVLDDDIRRGDSDLEQAEAENAQAQAELRADGRFAALTGPEALSRAEACRRDCQDCQNRAGAMLRRFLLLQLLGLLSGGALAGLAAAGVLPLHPLGGLAPYFVFALLSLFALRGRGGQLRQVAELLEEWSVDGPEELILLAVDHDRRWQQAEEANRHVKTIRLAVNERRVQRENSRAGLMSFVHTFAPEVRDLFGCSAALSRALGLEHDLALAGERVEGCRRRREDLLAQGGRDEEIPKPSALPEEAPETLTARLTGVRTRLEQTDQDLNRARGRQAAMGDPAALSARLEELEEQLERRRREYEAISLAMETLEQANLSLQTRFSPALSQLAGEYLSRLTGQRYASLTLSRELEGAVLRDGDVLPRSALYLSQGTTDQLYLAVRLAVCALCLEEKPPLMLDDALASFDDRRLAQALELLRELAWDQQVLLFTCHRREEALLRGAPDVRRLELG